MPRPQTARLEPESARSPASVPIPVAVRPRRLQCSLAAMVALAVALLAPACSSSALDGADAAAALDLAAPVAPSAPAPDMACLGVLCTGRCIDTASDTNNCGGCGIVCGANEVCQGFQCAKKPCASNGDCDDAIGCTVDQCLAGTCYHDPGTSAAGDGGVGACPEGTVCDAQKGCVAGAPPVVGPGLCFQDPPPGATLAPPPPVYKGVCPALHDATLGENTLMTSGNARNFLLAIPKNLDPKEKLPILFLWHWLGGSDQGFYDKGEVQAAVDQQRFIAVIPANKKVNGNSDLLWKWPFAVADSQARMDEEFQFFDDMYACVAAQFHINKECVASGGVSAGALFTDQLVQVRSNVLSSGISLSGGTGGVVRPWTHPTRRVPMLVLWGGPQDFCVVINFQDASHDLEAGLAADGNFEVECVHNCKHGEPPVDPPMGLSKYSSIWQFAWDHPYWLKGGDSPYHKTGLPSEYPPWCAIGKGNAIPRTGACPAPGC